MQKLQLQELNRISVVDFKQAQKTPIVVVLDNVRSMHNVGSVFRTSDAFAIEALMLCGITAQPPHREIEKTALGATQSVDWIYAASTLEAVQQLKEQGYKVFAIEQVSTSIDLMKFQPQTNQCYAFVFGNEVNGISNDILPMVDGCIEIPQFGTKHSFNVSVTAGIVLWDVFAKLKRPNYSTKAS